MKKFYFNSVVFGLIISVMAVFFDFLSTRDYWRTIIAKYTDSTEYIAYFPGTGEIKPYIDMVQRKDKTTKLIIGDSVCHQLFNDLQEYNEDFCIAGSNGAITMAGQYILVKEYLDKHPDATDVFLFVLPESLGRTFDVKLGYQYIVMPFVETDTLYCLDEDTIETMRSVYGSFFMRPDVVDAIDLSGVNRKLYLNYLIKHSEDYVQKNRFEIADRYICKMDKLCEDNGVKFHFRPCPVNEAKKEYVDKMSDEFGISEIQFINPEYMSEIYFYPSEQSTDGVHFTGKYTDRENLNSIIKLAYRKTELLEFLKFY